MKTKPAFPPDTKKDAANERLFNQNGGVVNINGIEHTKEHNFANILN